MFENIDWSQFFIGFIVIVLSITLHEFGHAISADRLGDPGPRRAGRISLWPDRHLDPFGTLMMIVTLLTGYGIGWGKPVRVNSNAFRHPRQGMLITAAFGPLMNLLLAVVFGLTLRIIFATHHDAWIQSPPVAHEDGSLWVTYNLVGRFMVEFVIINLSLMFFNLIPVHPLDGSKILSALLPIDVAVQYDRFVGQYGQFFLMFVALSGGRILGPVIGTAVEQSMRLITGT